MNVSVSPHLAALLLVALGLSLGVALYLTRYPALSPRKRAALVAVRALTLLLLLFATLGPVVRYSSSSRERNRMLILVDHSGSMEVRDGDASGRTRREVADSAAAAIATELRGRYDVRLAPFDVALGGIGTLDSWKRAGPVRGAGETALGDALREALDRVDPDSLAAMLVLSDGTVNRGEDPERVLESTVPTFALVTGSASEPPTTGIGGIDLPSEIVTGRTAVLTVNVRHGSARPVRGVARLSEGGRELARASFVSGGTGSLTRVSIPFTLGERGKHFLTVRLDSLPGDPITQNKRRLVAVTARPSKHVVPLLATSWDWDLRSLTRGVEEDTSWAVRRLVPSGPSAAAAPGAAARPFAQELRDVDAVVVRYDARVLTPERSAEILSFLARGGGVLFWTDPVARPPAPGALSHALGLEWRDVDAPAASGGLELTPAGRASETALLGGDAASAGSAWRALPPVQVPVVISASGALAPLVVARYGNETVPVLLAGRVGLGRVAVLNASGVYRWGLTASGLSGSGIEPALFGGLATWISQSADDRPVRITAPDITPAERPIPVRLALASAAPAIGARAIVRARGAHDVTLAPSPQGDFAGSVTLPEGVYTLHGRVERAGRVLGTDSVRVAVGEQGAEFEMLQADPSAMERLASRSGGLSAPIGRPERVLSKLRSPDIAKARLAELDLFHNLGLFLALVLGASAEWILRKRFHLL